MSSESLTFVLLKSFGDLVIARWAIRKLSRTSSAEVRLLLGSHLVELNKVLGDLPRTSVIEHGGSNVPPFFAVRQCGLPSALASGLVLRRIIGTAILPSETTLVFDRIGFRERLLTLGRHHAALPKASSNIYLAYEEFLRPHGLVSEPELPIISNATNGASYIGIFPDSRIGNKRISGDIVTAIARLCIHYDVPYKIFLLEGEPSDLSSSTKNIIRVPRQFKIMANAVRSARAVISADSMPAHMAEYFSIPVYVLSPVPNIYWLPKSCKNLPRWSLFSDSLNIEGVLSQFIGAC